MSVAKNLQTLLKIDCLKIHVDDPLAESKLAWDVMSRLQKNCIPGDRTKVLLCIGTDRSTGDCLGPLVGTKVNAFGQNYFHIFGTLEEPVHAGNLKEKIEQIKNLYEDPFIIAVDASLGRLESVGFINIGDGSIMPGAGVNKELPPVGDLHITGVVNVGGFLEFLVLQNTRLNTVMRMAEVIAKGLARTANELSNKLPGVT